METVDIYFIMYVISEAFLMFTL